MCQIKIQSFGGQRYINKLNDQIIMKTGLVICIWFPVLKSSLVSCSFYDLQIINILLLACQDDFSSSN